MRFNLTVNEQQRDGFKLTFNAEDKEQVKTCEELTKLLIEKIKSIEVKVHDYE